MITTTNRDYDLSEVSKAVRGVLIGVAFVSAEGQVVESTDADVCSFLQRWSSCTVT